MSPWGPRRGLAITIVLGAAFWAGTVRTRKAPVLNGAHDGADRVVSNVGESRVHARGAIASRAPSGGAGRSGVRRVAAGSGAVAASHPECEHGVTLALAELWYRAALRQPHPRQASAVPPLARGGRRRGTGPDRAGRRVLRTRTIEVHNDAVARLVRISQDERIARGRDWPGALTGLGVVASGGDSFVDPGRFAAVVVADDVRVCGMRHQFRTCGLGVPVIGTRCVDQVHPTETDEQFFPRRLRIAATVLAAPGGGLAGGAYRLSPLGLVFHDPFRVGSARAGGRALPLAADRTTHLALQASQDRLPAQAIRGVFASEFGPEIEPGLFMLRPYAPGKIPLVFVHGLAASPVAFVQAINQFQNDPELSAPLPVLGVPLTRPVGRSSSRPCGSERLWAGPRRRTGPTRRSTRWSSSGTAWGASSPTWSCLTPAGRSGTARLTYRPSSCEPRPRPARCSTNSCSTTPYRMCVGSSSSPLHTAGAGWRAAWSAAISAARSGRRPTRPR